MAVAAFRRFASKKNRERQTSDSALSEVSEVILRRTRRAGETVSMRFVSELCRPWGEMRDDAAGMATLEAIAKLPYHEQQAAGHSTIMRLLDAELEAHAAVVVGRNPGREGRRRAGGSTSTEHVEEMEL